MCLRYTASSPTGPKTVHVFKLQAVFMLIVSTIFIYKLMPEKKIALLMIDAPLNFNEPFY